MGGLSTSAWIRRESLKFYKTLVALRPGSNDHGVGGVGLVE